MKFKHSYAVNMRVVDLEDALLDGMYPAPYSSGGAIEDAREVADNAAKAVSKLIALLHAKGVLTDEEVLSTFEFGPFLAAED